MDPNQLNSNSVLWNAKRVAAILGVRPWTVYEMVKRGELPAVKIGNRIVRFRPESIHAWIAEKEATSILK